MKTCSRCKQEKSIDQFYKRKLSKGGVRSYCKICDTIYCKANAKKIAEYKKQYQQENAEKILEYQNRYRQERIKSDHLFKLGRNIRILISTSFKRNKTKNFKKQTKTETLLGCTISELRDHLEKQFQPGMTFENHGEWHIDHRIPVASATSQSEIEKLCHYTNLQPLWAKDNLSKGARIKKT